MTSINGTTLDPVPGIIIVGFDGSPSSRGALHQGVALAKALHADLRVIATWQYPISYLLGSPLANGSQELEISLELEDAIKDAISDHIPPWVSADIIQGGAADVLIEESLGAELLIVGSRGHGALTAGLLGSVSAACSAYAHCPVLVSRATIPGQWFDETTSVREGVLA